ncbi:MAG: ABC transporter substrate-binding protein [Clostridia bacterium]
MKTRKFLSVLVACALMMTMASVALAEDTIKIGGIAPLTGDVAVYGIANQQGMNLYIEEINAAGGVLGKQVEVEWLDDKGDITESVNAYNRLQSEGVVALLGPVTSKPALAVAEMTALDNMPMMTATATAYDVTTPGANVFRACFLDPYQGQMMASFASKTLEAKKVAVIYNNADDYSTGLAESFQAKAEELGMEVVAYESYAAGDIDFKAQLTNIQSKAPDALFCPDYYNTIALLQKQAKETGLTVPLLGADGWDGLLTVVEDGKELEGYYFCNHYSTQDEDPIVSNFLKNFEAKYGTTPNAFAALGYDAAKILCAGIEAAGSTDAEAVIAALTATNVDGVTGNITYDAHRDPQKSVAIITFKDGAYSLVEKIKP